MRLFHRRASAAAGSAPASPASPREASSSPLPPPPPPPPPVAARTRGSSPTRVAPAAADELRVMAGDFVRATAAAAQRRALQQLRSAITSAERPATAFSEQDRVALVTACAHRTQQHVTKSLEGFNTGRMQRAPLCALAMPPEIAGDCVAMLSVLGSLLTRREHAAVVVGERLPSSLVKVLKAVASSSTSGAADALAPEQPLADAAFAFLGSAIAFEEVVQELIDSSTLHRLFTLSFPSSKALQLATLALVEKLVRSRSRDMWRKTLVPHLLEHKCVVELLQTVQDDARVFAKVLSVSSYILKHAAAAGSLALHEQVRQNQFYQKLTAHFTEIFERNQRQVAATASPLSAARASDSDLVRDQEAIALALSGLVLSGSESGKSHNDVATQKFFALVDDDLPHGATRSLFNCDAFRALADILEFLHHATALEQQSSGSSTETQRTFREQLEGKYIERIGRILCHSRYDYVLVMKTRVLEQVVLRLDEYSELTKATVGSVLSAIAIEARVIPYAELAAMALVLHKDVSDSQSDHSSVSVLLGILTNLLRFHGSYARILSAVGVLESLLELFRSECLRLPAAGRGIVKALESSEPDVARKGARLSNRDFVALVDVEAFRDHGMLLWNKMLRLALLFKRQNTSVYNAVNCLLQAVRSATLSLSPTLATVGGSSESVDREAIVSVSLAMRLLHILFVHNKMVGQEFSSNASKIWPPTDGYSVMLWFRVDALETKSEREALYREYFLARKCVLCSGALRDETALKCSHRACRPCTEALLNSSGECVICNPPMFFLFRFRSGDSKSVSEAFLRGTRVFMRTTPSRTVHPFNHAPIEPQQWHHAAFVHSRQRFQPSTLSFYLDGVLQETAKISYPSSITSGQPLSSLVGTLSQARRVSSSHWTVGAFYLVDEPVSAFAINTVFAAGPRYDGLFSGVTGNSEVAVCFDGLSVRNLAAIDEYMRDPIRALIESVDAERVSKSSFLRGSLSLASAASSAAAAIVQDIKSDAGVFARLPSAVPLINIPIQQERVLLAYSARNAAGLDTSIVPSTRLDGRPIAHMMGGTTALAPATIGDVLYELSSSGCQVAYVLLESACTALEVQLSLRLLRSLMHGNALNLEAMEQEHGYGIVSFLLHQKARLLGTTSLQLLFQIVGVDIQDDERNDGRSVAAGNTERSIRNLQALQHFVLDYSLWQKVHKDAQRLLFSTLYSCLVAGDEELRERNRVQLQSLSIVRQLLYVFLDPDVEPDLLRVIVDLILVCLTGIDRRDSSLEANFADVASFLTSTLSPKFFARTSSSGFEAFGRQGGLSDAVAVRSPTKFSGSAASASSNAERAVALLSLSPRGSSRSKRGAFFTTATSAPSHGVSFGDEHAERVSAHWRHQQVKIQDLLLDMLLKAVQKHDLKESKDRDEADGTVTTTSDSASGAPTPTFTSGKSSSVSGTSGLTTASRIQLPSSHRLTGFRKVLSPRWVSFFLFPSAGQFNAVPIAPSTVILALKLLCALLSRPRYEAYFSKEGYYRLLSQSLPSSQRAFDAASTGTSSTGGNALPTPSVRCPSTRFPFDKMWYTLFCVLLGTPVDGIPHRIKFDMFFLTKDFELNIQNDRVLNPNIVGVILGVMRRHYNDPVALDALRQSHASASVDDFALHQQREKTRMPLSRQPDGAGDDRPASEGELHTQVLGFLHYLYTSMPAFHKLLATGSDKFRMEFLEELALLACAASRQRVLDRYAPTRKRVLHALLNQNKDGTAYEAALCAASLAEEAASKDDDAAGHDPFSHPSAVGALRLLVSVLMTFLLDFPKGNDVLEALFANALGADLAPPLPDGLHVHFQSLVVLGLVAQIRDAFNSDEVFADHKMFAPNLRDFLKFTVQKMHSWQRSQHGDACPAPFACCGIVHFQDGPTQLLELALFVLAETSLGIVAGAGGGVGGFSVLSAASTTLGGMLQDKLNKGKKRRQIRQIIGRMSLSKPAELESLVEALYATLNAVVLHKLHGHRVEVDDTELAAMLQLLHMNRDVVLGSRNKQDKDFFVCLCRYLLQLLGDASAALQEAAVHVWVDLLYFQRAFMVELLTIEIRRAGAPPYSVNLMKSGFDALLECPSTELPPAALEGEGGELPSTRAINSAGFIKFKKWLELVGPPLKELEITLDRTFLKSIVEVRESVRENWTAHHKNAAARATKHARRFAARYEWLADTNSSRAYALSEMQQKEFRRQVKWRQDRVDRQKFIARQWQHVKRSLYQHALGDAVSDEDAYLAALSNPAMLSAVAKGPFRMRKRFIKSSQWTPNPEKQQLHPNHNGGQRHNDDDGSIDATSGTSRQQLNGDGVEKDGDGVDRGRFGSFEEPRQVDDDGSTRLSQSTRGSPDSDDDDTEDRDEAERSTAYFPHSGGGDSLGVEENAVDEKLRPLLVPGDDIMDIYDCLRIDGMDSCPGVFILCNDHAYIVDNYQRLAAQPGGSGAGSTTDQRAAQSQVVEVSKGAPTRLERGLSLRHRHSRTESNSGPWGSERARGTTDSPSPLVVFTRSSFTHQCRFWSYDDIVELHKRRYQLQHVALELFAHDGRNYLITFESTQQRENVFHSLLNKCPNVRGAANGIDRTVVTGDLYSQLRKLMRNSMTERWIGGEISNFEYLMHLNTLAGRSYNDLTQYPVFPWILSDYTSEAIDLNDPSVFRDLSKPMGALNREDEFRARYDGLSENPDASDLLTAKPFHYGTHYSSAAIVLYYLMRVEPFSTHLLHLQGGKFDHADRLFSSVRGAWNSAAGVESAQNGTQDVKELIPEFFYLPAFLTNANRVDFGRDQSGATVDGVALPPWAHGSAKEFVRVNREALESSFVSARLHLWIDLIFGCKQQGAAAVDACNVFYHLTYEGAVDLDSVADDAMRRAIVDQINEFGQTPSQLFKTPHPAKARVPQAPSSSGSLPPSALSASPNSLGPGASDKHAASPSTGDASAFTNPALSSASSTSSAGLAQPGAPPLTSRSALASSLIGAMESSELVNRMQTILSTTAGAGSTAADTTRLLDDAVLLQPQVKREVALNPLLASHRGRQVATAPGAIATAPRPRQLSSGALAPSIRQVALSAGSVAREERVAAIGDRCLLLPPRHTEFLAWGFQDRSLKVLSVGASEVGAGGDSKVLASFEVPADVGVACVTSDGRTVVTGGARAPVLRMWEFSAKKSALASSAGGAGRRRAYTMGLHAGSHSARSLTLLATLAAPAHHRAITAVAACRAYSIAVSGCSGGVVVLWDLNRKRYLFTLPPFSDLAQRTARVPPECASVAAVCINEVSGDIVVATGARFGVYDVNGVLLARLCYDALRLDPAVVPRAPVTALALNRSSAAEWSKEKAVVTGHADGALCVWAYSQSGEGDDDWSVELKKRHAASSGGGAERSSRSAVTAVFLTSDERTLYTGSADGLLSVWTPKLSPPASSS
ncbi:hypothetical protein PybrP1_001824 [[Pythium] brassicae (nom. inval.)]|nr:hypothetical protein PybrP1_001824 [[Pythium] brassicae (nom. inval.)]